MKIRKIPRIVLVSVNARYTHSNPALYTLEKLCINHAEIIHHETTISCNPAAEAVLIAHNAPDIVVFSAYIWNGDVIKKTAEALRAELPETIIVAGGPEALNNCWPGFIAANSLRSFTEALKSGGIPNIPESREYHIDELPFAYSSGQLESMRGRYLYYETSRGCAFSCAYCLSGAAEKLTFRSIGKVKDELDKFISHNVMTVKFVDRTFNIDPGRSLEIWKHIVKNNRNTVFHFEVHPAIMSEEEIEFCASVPPGMFRFEAGIQTTTPEVLDSVNRSTDTEKALETVARLSKPGNIHLHAGLIAGLPGETPESFRKSIDDTVRARPAYIQTGTLKILKGSPLYERAQKESIIFSSYPPYQVLSTPYMGLSDIVGIARIEKLFDLLYNDTPFPLSLEWLLAHTDSVSGLFGEISEYCTGNNISLESHKNEKKAALLRLAAQLSGCEDEYFYDRMALETASLLMHYPEWLSQYSVSARAAGSEVRKAETESGRRPSRSIIFVPRYPETPLLAGLPPCRAYCYNRHSGPPFEYGGIWFSG